MLPNSIPPWHAALYVGVSGKNSTGKIVPLLYGISIYCKVYFKPLSFCMFLKLGLLMGKRLFLSLSSRPPFYRP